MNAKPRTDRPRTNRDPQEVARKLALLDEPHVKPLSDYVRRLRAERGGDESIPWFDPTDAGTKARILMLFEAPGPRATATRRGSGFISNDNRDLSAKSMWELLREARIDRSRETVSWNVVPWYIGSDRRIRAAKSEDIREASEALVQFLLLLPELRVVLLFGIPAAEAWERVSSELPTIEAPHPSPVNLNTRPHYRGVILEKLIEARRRAEGGDRPGKRLSSAYEVMTATPSAKPAKRKHPLPSSLPRRVQRKNRPPAHLNRESIRSLLLKGLTPIQVGGGSWPLFYAALEEEARLEGEFDAFEPTPQNATDLRDRRRLRWERIAVRVYGDPRRTKEVRALYDAAKGVGAAKRSYVGLGRRFPEMKS